MVKGAMVEKSCSRSQGQPEPGVRNAAMIAIRRSMSREGSMRRDFHFLERTRRAPFPAARLYVSAPKGAVLNLSHWRERYGLAALRRVDHSHIDRLALRQMGDAGRAEDRDVDEDVLAAVVA